MSAPSPFFEGTKLQFVWDSTSLGWFKTCPRLYQYQMIEGWRPRGSNLHFIFGAAYHKALEDYDKARALGADHEEGVRAAVQTALHETWIDGAPWASDDPNKNRQTLVRSVVWYLDQFRDDPARTVILANGKPAVELSFKFETKVGSPFGDNYMISGHLDRVVEFQGAMYVMDRKTTKSTLSSYYFEKYHVDNQMTLYTLAGQVVWQLPVKGVIIDGVQVAVGFTKFQRGMTYRTGPQLEEWQYDFTQWLALAEAYADMDYWPLNDTACDKYGGCPFRRICGRDPAVRQHLLETDFERRHWNPLEER